MRGVVARLVVLPMVGGLSVLTVKATVEQAGMHFADSPLTWVMFVLIGLLGCLLFRELVDWR